MLDLGWARQQQKNDKSTWLKTIVRELDLLQKRGLEILVIDSLNVLYELENFTDRRKDLYALFNHLKKLRLTCLIIGEAQQQSEERQRFDFESYLVDGIINIASVKRNLTMVRELTIQKMRYADHSTNVFIFSFDSKRHEFKLAEKLAVL